MLPDLLSPLESCYQHSTQWLLLPRRQKPSACPLAAVHISEGSDASPGSASPDGPWEEKTTSTAYSYLQRNKSFFKTTLSLFTNSSLRLSGCLRHTSLTKETTKVLYKLPSQSAWWFGGGEQIPPQLKASTNQNRFPVKPITLLILARGCPCLPEVDLPFQRSVPSWSLPAPETFFGEMPTVPAVEMKTSCFHQRAMAYYTVQRPLSWNSPSLHPMRSQLKYGRFWAHFR